MITPAELAAKAFPMSGEQLHLLGEAYADGRSELSSDALWEAAKRLQYLGLGKILVNVQPPSFELTDNGRTLMNYDGTHPNPFKSKWGEGQVCDASDRMERVKRFTFDELRQAQRVTGLQKNVRAAIESRLRNMSPPKQTTQAIFAQFSPKPPTK